MCWYVWASLFLYLCVWWSAVACVSANTYTQRAKDQPWSHSSSISHLGFWDRQRLSLCLELADWTKSACQQATGILPLPPQHWDYKNAPPCPAFLFLTGVLGIKLRFSALDSKRCLAECHPSLPFTVEAVAGVLGRLLPSVIHLMVWPWGSRKFYYFEDKT